MDADFAHDEALLKEVGVSGRELRARISKDWKTIRVNERAEIFRQRCISLYCLSILG